MPKPSGRTHRRTAAGHAAAGRTAPLWTALLAAAALGANALVATGCTGPHLHVDNPERDQLFLDGVVLPGRARERHLPFRYYGTTRWHALPHLQHDGPIPQFDRLPAEGAITITPPVSQWLFPFDFALELGHRLIAGRGDHLLSVRLPEVPADERQEEQISPDALGALRASADVARTLR